MITIRWTLAAAAAALCAGTALAANPSLPPELPKFAADKPLPVPALTRKTLANGLQVWVLPRNGVPRVDFVLAVRGAGYGADAPDAPGFANVLAGLLNEGTQSRSSKDIAEAAQSLGGGVSAGASNDGINVVANALASKAPAMAQLMADVALRPSFPEAEVKLAQANALQSLKANQAQPGFRAARALNAAIYGDHAYGRTQPTEAALQALNAAALRSAHAQRFRPDQALLVIAGKVAVADALKMAQDAFGGWKAQGAPAPELAAPPARMPVQRLLLERPGSVQATLRLGRPGPAASGDEQVALRVASAVLGTGFSSRVNMNLREEKGYTYGARAGASSYRVGGAISGGADVRNEVTGAAITEYIREYRRLGEELVPAEELAVHKRSLIGGYLLANQMQGAVAAQLAGNWLVKLPPEFLARYVPAVQKVSAEQVRAVAQAYFKPEEQSWVVVGDPAQIAEQLKPFGEFRTLK